MAAQERARRPRNRARKPKNRARMRKNFLGQTSVKNWHVTLVSTMIQQHFMRNCMDTYLMRSQWTVTTNMSWIIHDVWVNMCISWVFPTKGNWFQTVTCWDTTLVGFYIPQGPRCQTRVPLSLQVPLLYIISNLSDTYQRYSNLDIKKQHILLLYHNSPSTYVHAIAVKLIWW